MRVLEARAVGACVLLCAGCDAPTEAARHTGLEPVRAAFEPACERGLHSFGATCVGDVIQERTAASSGAPVTFELRQADGRWWWFTSDRVSFSDAVQLCESLDATVFLPRSHRDWGVAMHFSSLTLSETGLGDNTTISLGLRVNQHTGVVEAQDDGRALFLFRPDMPPLPGIPDESLTQRVLEAIAAVAAGRDPDPMAGCFRADPDGSIRASLCDHFESPRPVVCGPAQAP